MTSDKKIAVGLSLLAAALLVGAVAAQGASAVVKGTTAFTCAPSSIHGAGFSKEHCKEEDAVSSGASYEHVAIPEGVRTEATVSNATTNGGTAVAKLKTTISGTAVELQATGTHAEGWMENSKDESGEHYIHGEGATVYTGVTVTKPANKGCKVYADEGGVKGVEGEIHTSTLKGTSTAQGMRGKLEPAEGGAAAHFIIEGCSVSGLNQTYTVTGSVTCPGNGATVLCSDEETTAEETLFLNERKMGVEVATTPRGRASSSESYTPLAVTTVET